MHKKEMIENIINEKVSRETIGNILIYEKLLLEYNNYFNLISKNDTQKVWERHIIDSCQFYNFIKEKKIILDLGSGGGFPVIILAILFKDILFYATESITKKAKFLQLVKEELKINNLIIENDRIEKLKKISPDIITARAFKDISTTLFYANLHKTKHTSIVTAKGKKVDDELQLAKQNWVFDFKKYTSKLDPEGVIIKITHFEEKNESTK